MIDSEKQKRKIHLLREIAVEIIDLPHNSNLLLLASYLIKGDPIADLYEDIAAEEKARATYQYLINMTDDVDLQDSLKFLREREIVHSQRFKEAVELLKTDRQTKKIF